MIKEKYLEVYHPEVRLTNSQDMTLDGFRRSAAKMAKEYLIPIEFRKEEARIDGVVRDVLVIHHPEHSGDYFNCLIQGDNQGKFAYVTVYKLGESTQFKKQDAAAAAKAGVRDVGKAAWNGLRNSDGSIGGMFKSAFGAFKGTVNLAKAVSAGANSIGGNNRANLRDEERWYELIDDLLTDLLV